MSGDAFEIFLAAPPGLEPVLAEEARAAGFDVTGEVPGGVTVQGGWPEDDRALVRAERHELQRRLTAKGFDTGGIDGNIGPDTRAALMRYQRSIGAVPDGNASWQILKRLR